MDIKALHHQCLQVLPQVVPRHKHWCSTTIPDCRIIRLTLCAIILMHAHLHGWWWILLTNHKDLSLCLLALCLPLVCMRACFGSVSISSTPKALLWTSKYGFSSCNRTGRLWWLLSTLKRLTFRALPFSLLPFVALLPTGVLRLGNHGHNRVETSTNPHLVQSLSSIGICCIDLVKLSHSFFSTNHLLSGVLVVHCILIFFVVGIGFFKLIPCLFLQCIDLLVSFVLKEHALLAWSWLAILVRHRTCCHWTLWNGILANDKVHRLPHCVQGDLLSSKGAHDHLALILSQPCPPQEEPSDNLVGQGHPMLVQLPQLLLKVSTVLLDRLIPPPVGVEEERLKVIGQLRQGVILEHRVKPLQQLLGAFIGLKVCDAQVFHCRPCTACQGRHQIECRLLRPARKIHLPLVQHHPLSVLLVLVSPIAKLRNQLMSLASIGLRRRRPHGARNFPLRYQQQLQITP